MATTTNPTLDAQVDDALTTLKRRRVFKGTLVVLLIIATGALLFGLTGLMYQEPLDSQQGSGQMPQP